MDDTDTEAIRRSVELSTVLTRYTGAADNASGVLVELADRFFVFSAAHALNDTRTRLLMAKGLGAGQDAVELKPRSGVPWGTHADDPAPDAAVVEVEAEGDVTREWLHTRAVQPPAVLAVLADELPPGPMHVMMSGIPAATRFMLGQQARHLGHGIASVHDHETIDASRPFRLPIRIDGRVENIDTGEADELPDLGGMSGGGTWGAASGAAYLIGTHRQRVKVRGASGRKRWVAITTLVTAHLCIVAGSCPELTAWMRECFPVLREIALNQLASAPAQI